MGSTSNKYTPEFKQRAVQLYQSRMPVTYAEVARELGVDPGTLSKWVAQARPSVDAEKTDNPFQMAEDLRKLRRENERLRRENEILLKASAFFASRQL
jgi:transposase